MVDVFGELKENLCDTAANLIIISFLDVKDDVMFEIERSLELEYLYRNIYFPNILADQSFNSEPIKNPVPVSLEDQDDKLAASNGNLAASDLSQRILSLLSTERNGIPLAIFFSNKICIYIAEIEVIVHGLAYYPFSHFIISYCCFVSEFVPEIRS